MEGETDNERERERERDAERPHVRRIVGRKIRAERERERVLPFFSVL